MYIYTYILYDICVLLLRLTLQAPRLSQTNLENSARYFGCYEVFSKGLQLLHKVYWDCVGYMEVI